MASKRRLSDDGELVRDAVFARDGNGYGIVRMICRAILQWVNEAGFAAGLGESAVWIEGD